MEIYYGRFLRATKAIVLGESYIYYFNSEQAVYDYHKHIREVLKREDILEAIGKAYFNSKGRLVLDDDHETLLYNPDEE